MAKTERSGHTTTDHDFIRQWVEERGGWPARVKGTESGDDAGLIRIDFPDYSGGDRLERIAWEEWFEKFEESDLAFLHRDLEHDEGELDRFNKLVRREEGAESRSSGRAKRSEQTDDGGKAPGSGPEMEELRELLLHELGDLLYAERRFLTATRGLARETRDPQMKERMEEHVEETEAQIERLEKAFEALGERAKAVKCEGAIGLREEHDSFKSERPSKMVLEVFDIGAGLRVEHYEIAAYTAAILLAEGLGETECAEILQENLKEEEAMAAFLKENAPKALQRLTAELV